MTNYSITVNNRETTVTKSDIDSLDLIKIDETNFHLLQNNQAFRISLQKADFLSKTFWVLVNGNIYELGIEDKYDQRIKEMGFLTTLSQKVNSVKAPMPGLIIDIMVEEGQRITDGTPLLILSAMKMENIILSPGEGTIKSIKVKKEDTVEKGQLIIEIE